MMNHGGSQKSLNALLRKPTKFKDNSFPPKEYVVLRSGSFYWWSGSAAILLTVFLLFANIWAGADRAIVGQGDIEEWIWRCCWCRRLAAEAWHQGLWRSVLFFFSAGAAPGVGSVLDLYLFSWPLEMLAGESSYYNYKAALILVLNCGACWFALSKIWGADIYAWPGGFIFGINSFTIGEIAQGRCRSVILFTVPLCLLRLYEALRSKSAETADKWLWIRASLWLGLTWAFNPQYGLGTTVVVLAWALWSVWRESFCRLPREAAVCLGTAILGAVLYLPWAAAYIMAWGSGHLEEAVGGGYGWGQRFPSAQSVQDAEKVWPAAEKLVSAQPDGQTVLLDSRAREQWLRSLPINALFSYKSALALPLLVLAVLLIPYRLDWRIPWLWLALGSLFTVFCWGPYPSWSAGASDRLTVLSGAPLPYAWCSEWLPGGALLPPDSMLPFVYLCLAVLLVIRAGQITGGHPGYAQLLAGLVAAAQLAQLYAASLLPIPTTRLEVGPFYYLLGAEEPVGIVEVPDAGAYLDLAQFVHKGPSLAGGASRWYPRCLSAQSGSRTALWSRAKLDGSHAFYGHLLQSRQAPGKWMSWLAKDRGQLLDRGFSLLILHERSCNILAGERGEILYFDYFSRLQDILGEPLVSCFEPAYEGMPGRRAVDTGNPVWYRVAVFSLKKNGMPVHEWMSGLEKKK